MREVTWPLSHRRPSRLANLPRLSALPAACHNDFRRVQGLEGVLPKIPFFESPDQPFGLNRFFVFLQSGGVRTEIRPNGRQRFSPVAMHHFGCRGAGGGKKTLDLSQLFLVCLQV